MTDLLKLKARRTKLIALQRAINIKLSEINTAIDEVKGGAARRRELMVFRHNDTLHAIKETRALIRSRRHDQRLKHYLAHLLQTKTTKGAEAHIPLSKY